MKAHIPAGKKMTRKQRETVREFASEILTQQQDEANRKASEVFILASACVLHQSFGFGKHRLCRYMEALQSFYGYLDGFDDAAKYRCLQILKDIGIDWEPKREEQKP